MQRLPHLAAGLLAGILLAGCTYVIQPPAAPVLEPEIEPVPMAIELPDGTTCAFAGTGATLAFDGKRVNYTCTPGPAVSYMAGTEVALLGDPTFLGGTEWEVERVTMTRAGDEWTLESSEIVPFTAWRVVLVDDTECLHAGFGATLGFEQGRLNYTCRPVVAEVSGSDELGLLGDLVPEADGIWLATAALIARTGDGFELQAAAPAPVALISGLDTRPAAPAEGEAAGEGSDPAANPLVGPVWEWQATVLENGPEIAVETPSNYTLTFNPDGTLSIQFDCNSGFGDYTVDGDQLTFGPMGSTMMACPEGGQVEQFSTDLATVTSYVLEEGNLILNVTGGRMVFAPAAGLTEEGAPVENPLAGTTWGWVQTQYGDGAIEAAVDPARYTLTFNADGTLNAQVDCNRGSGSYTIDGPSLTVGPLATTRMACPADSQDSIFLRDLEGVVSYVLEGETLALAIKFDTGIMVFQQVQ